MEYDDFVQRLYQTGSLGDPWIAGKRRFCLTPLWLDAGQLESMYLVAERVAAIIEEMAVIVREESVLLDSYFMLTPWQKMMWMAAEGRWHGIARVDLFLCSGGRWQACEINSDTPSGEAEAVLLNRLLLAEQGSAINPNSDFEQHFRAMLGASLEAAIGGWPRPLRAGILYPTDLSEDLSLIALYRDWLESWGCKVVLGSPFNLGTVVENGRTRVALIGQPVDLILRHYKTDWWGEREEIWRDQPPWADPDPLVRELSILLAGEREGRVAVVNPFGSVLTQNKLAFAFLWDYRARFTPSAQEWIEEYIPETRRLVDLDPPRLDREEWVLKSVYGCEGDSVVVGTFVSEDDWRRTIENLIPRHWIAQRYFEVTPFRPLDSVAMDYDGWRPNYGIFIIGGRAAGIFTRLAKLSTDHTAVTLPTFVHSSSL
ncbi:MAG: hypothetical protein EBU88_02710 [Acidobacteria bacterium]|nr:hypothetical protein [Acidobacteriota bacterium]